MTSPSLLREYELDALLSVEAGEEFARARAMSAAWDGMAQSIFSTDGSWEAARARFQAVKGVANG